MTKILPMLDGSGWLSDPKLVLETMISHAIIANYSQSNRYYGTIVSIPYIISQYEANPSQLVYELENRLKAYLATLMYNVNVTVSYTESNISLYSYDITLSASGFKDGEFNDLRLSILYGNGVIKNVIKLINE